MFHPYAHTMMKTLRMAFPEIKLDISVKGEPGDEVSSRAGTFYIRLKHECAFCIFHLSAATYIFNPQAQNNNKT